MDQVQRGVQSRAAKPAVGYRTSPISRLHRAGCMWCSSSTCSPGALRAGARAAPCIPTSCAMPGSRRVDPPSHGSTNRYGLSIGNVPHVRECGPMRWQACQPIRTRMRERSSHQVAFRPSRGRCRLTFRRHRPAPVPTLLPGLSCRTRVRPPALILQCLRPSHSALRRWLSTSTGSCKCWRCERLQSPVMGFAFRISESRNVQV